MKKKAIPKRKGLKQKTSDEKRGNSKTQGARNQGDLLNQKAKNH
jgi:hypothetical protein